METTIERLILGPFLFACYAFIAVLLFACAAFAWGLVTKWKQNSPRQRLWDSCLLTALLAFAMSLTLTVVNTHLGVMYGGETVRGDADGDRFFVANHGKLALVSEEYYRLKTRIETLAFRVAPFGFVASFSVFFAQAVRQQRRKAMDVGSLTKDEESDRSRDSRKRR